MVRIRPLASGDSKDEYLDLRFRAFGVADEARICASAELAIANESCLAAFDDGHMIGTALFWDLRQWWHGKAMPMAGVAGVKIAPEYRSKGVGRALMTELTQLMTERGYPLSALFAATSPFYRSLGWERAGAVVTTAVPSRSLLAFADPDLPGTGEAVPALRRAGPGDAAEVIAVLGRAYAVARDCGPVTFDEGTVRQWLTDGRWAGKERYAYLADDGFLAYGWHGGSGDMIVDKLVAVSPETTRALWSVVASHSSIAQTISAQVAPADPIWWLLREQPAFPGQRGEPATREWWMLRVLDARAAIAARGFPGLDIDVPLHITDDRVPANTGSWTLTIRSGVGSLVPATATAAAVTRLGARGFAALYAGVPVTTLRTAGLVDGGNPEGDAALDSAFAATAFMLDLF
jgi:predicted acetyltransferase